MPNIPVYISSTWDDNDAQKLKGVALQWQLPEQVDLPEGLAVTIDNNKLSVKDFANPKQQGVAVDFLSASSLYRQQHGGRKKEPLAKAVGLKGLDSLHVVDATPGLGRDAFVLVSLGCRVTMIERSPVVAALLDDGLKRLALQDEALASRFTLIHGDSIEQMQNNLIDVDVVYLDPMFPHRKKSALVKKEMRLFQQLLGADEDADDLLAPARTLAKKRVVVKRPAYAEPLANRAPETAITSKKHRFDVYITLTH
ncbi:class I SAM-dependent methyltransferase [Alteromonas sp. C1M14]|uniref:class I SAM-dependent methyltransferase n=1 Tax=Alteromonas sp. C1M14 TaxID=2841567 RepID=UPI001C095122|nr:class I SAM-dependent methyltransferase [Alteromonas sp. C1M14]MBU2979968.1 class I SAM-dependent methyltransferase [Alteromonas sp. C1M14]